MKILNHTFAACIGAAVLTLSSSPVTVTAQSIDDTALSACPADVGKARKRIENFIFPRFERIPMWMNEELGKTIPELAEVAGRSQITLLADPEHTEICEIFNSLYGDSLTLKYEDANRAKPAYVYDFVYYNVGAYYAVVAVHAPVPQPDYPGLVSASTGHGLIAIYDHKLNLIQDYGV